MTDESKVEVVLEGKADGVIELSEVPFEGFANGVHYSYDALGGGEGESNFSKSSQ